MDKNQLLRNLPKMDVLLAGEGAQSLILQYGYDSVREAFRNVQEDIRNKISTCYEIADAEQVMEQEIGDMEEHVEEILRTMYQPHLKKVLNGTGTVLHTNLGRAPLSRQLVEEATREVYAYSNLEFDLEVGVRGNRGEMIEGLLCELTGAEAAVVVNNNAAAVLLALHALSKGGDTIVSRGELVEVGGSFRIPDVMELSGAHLVEVGTTNKTKLSDYQQAITENTKVLLKVHTSNYRIIGFTEEVSVEELHTLGLPVVEDLGSGALLDLQKYGFSGEPYVQDSLRRGADVVCFSGDKLLGGPQAGILVGKKQYINQMKSNPVYRAMRIDKFTAAILEKVLLEYRCESRAVESIPVLRMLTRDLKDVEEDARYLKEMLETIPWDVDVELYSTKAQVGGGSLPLTLIPSVAIACGPRKENVEAFAQRLRKLPLPIVGRIEKGKFLIDLRTFEMEYIPEVIKELKENIGP